MSLMQACTTDPVTLSRIRVEGHAFDERSLVGIEGVDVALRWEAGAFGHGSSSSASSDVTGKYLLVVAFEPAVLCDPGTFDLVHTIPEGYAPTGDAFAPLECVESLQVRDLPFAALGGAN